MLCLSKNSLKINVVYIINLFIFAASIDKRTNIFIKTLSIMEKSKEQNKEMTAQESLGLISETLNNNRRCILQNSAKHFILWGALLFVTSLVIYELLHVTRDLHWNLLWFAVPIVGFPLARLLGNKGAAVPQNVISSQLHYIWLAYCAFAVVISVVAMFEMPSCITLVLVVLLGFAECLSGLLLKNWPIIIGGFILGVGGAVVAMLVRSEAQLLVFAAGGLILAATGLIVKQQYR